MAKLAIKGHKTRGKEVIEILEMLGGKNKIGHSADCDSAYFYIGSNSKNIYYFWFDAQGSDKYIAIFTLEEFLEKFPHKVGDKVCFPDDLSTPFTINKMWWDENANELLCSFIEDDIEVPVVGIRTYKEESIDKTNKVIFEANAQSCDIMNDIIKEEDTGNGIVYDEIDFDRCPAADKVHLILGDNYEIKEENGNYYVVRKKPQYPKTYEECCEILGIDVSRTIEHSVDLPFYRDVTCYENNLLSSLAVLRKLLICRNAYWKIAGEQMGLGKPWEPVLGENFIYAIGTCYGTIEKRMVTGGSGILLFPTEEMRDAFYENFKDLIEQCKELL